MATAGPLHLHTTLHAHRRIRIAHSWHGCEFGLKLPNARNARRISWNVKALAGHDCCFLDSRQCLLDPLTACKNAEFGSLLVGEIFDCEPPEEVVHEASSDPDLWIVSHARWLEPHASECLYECTQRNPVLQAVTDGDREGVHDSRESGTLLGHLDEDLAWTAILVFRDGDESFAICHSEIERVRCSAPWELSANGLINDPLYETFDRFEPDTRLRTVRGRVRDSLGRL